VAIEAGAEDVQTTEIPRSNNNPKILEKVLTALNKAGFEQTSAEITKVADAYITLDKEKTAKALKLIEQLDDHDDVQTVATNLDIPDGFSMEE
jgi:transcriptional/translational regulatory protein YebC/TACO1